MDLWLEYDDVERLVFKAFASNDDGLGLARFIPADKIGRYKDDHHSEIETPMVAEICRRMLLGHETMPDGPRLEIDELTARMLLRHGVDPLRIARIAKAARGIGMTDADGDRVVLLLPDAMVHTIHDGDLSVVTGRQTLIQMPRLPDTVVAGCGGRRLRDLVAHPVLDAMPLVVVGVADLEETSEAHTTLLVSGAGPHLDDDQLAALTRASRPA